MQVKCDVENFGKQLSSSQHLSFSHFHFQSTLAYSAFVAHKLNILFLQEKEKKCLLKYT